MSLPKLKPRDLVAVIEPPGPAWLDYVAAAWDAEAALLPLDPRLSSDALSQLLAAASPTGILDGGTLTPYSGRPVETGTALVIATSGTTGPAKAVELSRTALQHSVAASAERLGLTGSESWSCVIPVSHIGGMLVVFRSLLLGSPVHFPENESAFADWTSIVPAQLRRLTAQGANLSGRGFLVGGDHLASDLMEEARSQGARVVSTYGMSETCGGVVYDGQPLKEVQVRVSPGERIEIAGPTLMTGYRDRRPSNIQNGWFLTNDQGTLTDGLLTVSGRVDDVVIVSGEKFSKSAIQETVAKLPGIQWAKVSADKDPNRGAVLVVTYSGSLDERAVTNQIRATHGGLAATARIQRVD